MKSFRALLHRSAFPECVSEGISLWDPQTSWHIHCWSWAGNRKAERKEQSQGEKKSMLSLRSKGRGKKFDRNQKQRRRVGWRLKDWWHWAAGIAGISVSCFYLSPSKKCSIACKYSEMFWADTKKLYLTLEETSNQRKPQRPLKQQQGKLTPEGALPLLWHGHVVKSGGYLYKKGFTLSLAVLQEVTLTESSNKYRIFCTLTADDP